MIKKVQDDSFKSFSIFHYCSTQYDKLANAVFLMCAFMIVILKSSAEKAFAKFGHLKDMIIPFRDST